MTKTGIMIAGHGSTMAYNKGVLEMQADLLRSKGFDDVYVGFNEFSIPSIREIVCRYLLSPPQLAGNAPVVYILHPVTVSVAVFVRNQPDAAALH